MKQHIAAIIREYNTPTVTVEVANTDRYDSEQIEIRRGCGWSSCLASVGL